ncbi:MAG: outer membrane beta-barrel protein, partial [Cyclobacteriaceae bacterium]|nr:outer membrane beta-barrel protein [Cyclobacteriaceae bacterium]
MQKIYFLALMVLSQLAFSQSGTIKGKIKDEKTGEGIIGGNVIIEGTAIGASTDVDGNYVIPKVKAGKYNIQITYVSYKTKVIPNVEVYPDQITVLNTGIEEDALELESVTITTKGHNDTEISIVSEIKTSQLVVVGISAQQISMSQDRDAAQVVKRIPGVTILNNKFVNVRGLSERYSTVLLNGVIAPSTEVDSRAFAFDLIPSNMIDRMLVYKSGGADLPGDFAGAVINIATKSVIDENELSVNFTTGFRAGTTFENFNTERGSNTDWLGFDNGYRGLPSSFPANNLSSYKLDSYRNRTLIANAGTSLNNNWNAIQGTAAPDLRTTINFSKSGSIGKMKLGNTTSLSFSNTRQRLQQENFYYEGYNAQQGVNPSRRYIYRDNRDATNARIGLISNFILQLNPSHIFEFRNLFNQQGSSQVTARTGQEDIVNFEVNNLGLNYSERSIYSGQFSGKHGFSDRVNLNWVYGFSNTDANQPDYRRIRSQRSIGSTDPFSIVPSTAGNAGDGRFFSKLNEKVHSLSLNLDYKLNPSANESRQSKISTGYYGALTDRSFRARTFSYFANSPLPSESYQVSFNQIYIPENLVNPNDAPNTEGNLPKFSIVEGTNRSDEYTAENIYHAGYLNFYKAMDKFKMTIGTRVEYNQQKLNSADDKGPVKVNNPITSYLPFVNLSYNFSEKALVRLAYSKTLNRPVFRELAPFNYYDFDRNANTYGFDSLKIADIHNVDLRWEKYPSASENISFGVFYKHFINPIESRLQQGSNIIYTFINAETATSFGAEVDFRKSLNGMTKSGFVDKLSLVFNAAVIKSMVTLPARASNQDKERAMQGQSPYVINGGLLYNNIERGIQVNVAYNVFGKRIFAIGDFNQQTGIALNPTQYEMPRNQIDLTISKDFGRKFNAKLGIQDILNEKYQLIQDTNSDKQITGFDDPIQIYRPGQYITLG